MATCCLTLYTHGYRYLPNRSSDTILPGAPILSYLALTTSMPEVCTPVPFQQVMSSQTNITIFFSKVGGWERKRQGRSTVYQYLMISLPGIQLSTVALPWSDLFEKCAAHLSGLRLLFGFALVRMSGDIHWVQTSSCCGCFVATLGVCPTISPICEESKATHSHATTPSTSLSLSQLSSPVVVCHFNLAYV